MENFLIEQVKKMKKVIKEEGSCNILIADTETTGLPSKNGPDVEVTSFGGIVVEVTLNEKEGFDYKLVNTIEENFHTHSKIDDYAMCITNFVREEENKKLTPQKKKQVFTSFYIENKLGVKNGSKAVLTSKELPRLENLVFKKYASKRFFENGNKLELTEAELDFAKSQKKNEGRDFNNKEDIKEIIRGYYFKDIPKKVNEKKEFLFTLLEKSISESELTVISSNTDKFSKEYYDNLIKSNNIKFSSYHNAGYDLDSVLKPTYGVEIDDSTIIDTMHFKFHMDSLKSMTPELVKDLNVPESGRVIKGQSVDNWVKKVIDAGANVELEELTEVIENLEEFREFHSAKNDSLLSAHVLFHQLSEVNTKLKPLLVGEIKEKEEKISFSNGIPFIRTAASLDNTIDTSKLISYLKNNNHKEIIIVNNNSIDYPIIQEKMEAEGIKVVTGIQVVEEETGRKIDIIFKNTTEYRKLLPFIQNKKVNKKDLEFIKKHIYQGEEYELYIRKEVKVPTYLESNVSSKIGSFSYQKQVSNAMTTNFETRKKLNSDEDESLEKGKFTTEKEQQNYSKIVNDSEPVDYYWFPKENISAFPDFNVLEALIENKDDVEKAFEILKDKSKERKKNGDIIPEEEKDFSVAFKKFKEMLYRTFEKNKIAELNYIQYKNMKKCGVEIDSKIGIPENASEEEIKAKISEHSDRLLKIELDTVEKMGNIDYIKFYILMLFIVSYTKPGPGRGSAAGSYMNMIFEITKPGMFYFLDFYRFLNPDRLEMPDVDVDFAANGPAAKLIGYLVSKANHHYQSETMEDHPLLSVFSPEARKEMIEMYYQDENKLETARISTETKASGKTILESALRLRGAPKFMLDAISAIGAWDEERTIYENINTLGEVTYEIFRMLPKELIDSMEDLKGLPVGMGQHAAGVLFPNMPISMLAIVNEEGAVEYTKKTIEDMLLIKMDFLGLSSLTDVQQTEKILEEDEDMLRENGLDKGFIEKILKEHDFSDPKVYKAIAEGKTSQTFQFFSPAAKRMSKGLAPLTLPLLSAISALNRPGPLQTGADKDFISTANEEMRKKYQVDFVSAKDWGKLSPDDKKENMSKLREQMSKEYDVVQLEDWVMEKIITYPKNELEEDAQKLKDALSKIPKYNEITKETYGVIIYQEQITSVAQELVGFLPGEAQELRSAVSKKKNMDKYSDKFKEGIVKKSGVSSDVAELFWENIEHFGEYAFNKAHTDSYSQITYLTQYLKENYSLEAYSVLINNVPDIKKAGLIQEILERSEKLFNEKEPFQLQQLKDIDSVTVPFKKGDKGYLGIAYSNLTGVGLKDIAPLIRFNKYGAKNLSEFILMNESSVSNSAIRAIVASLGAQGDLPEGFVQFSPADYEYQNDEIVNIYKKVLTKKVYAKIIKDSFSPENEKEEAFIKIFGNKKIMNNLDLLREYSKLFKRQGKEAESDFIKEKEKSREDLEKELYKLLEGKDSTFEYEIKPFVKLTLKEKYKAPVKGPNEIIIIKENLETGEKTETKFAGFFKKSESGRIEEVTIDETGNKVVNEAQANFIKNTINKTLKEKEFFTTERVLAEEFSEEFLKEIDNENFNYVEDSEVVKKGKANYKLAIKVASEELEKEVVKEKSEVNFKSMELNEDMINEIRAKYLKLAASMFKVKVNLNEAPMINTELLKVPNYTSGFQKESSVFIVDSTLSGDKEGIGYQTREYIDKLSENVGMNITYVPYFNLNDNQFKALKEVLTGELYCAHEELEDISQVEMRNNIEKAFQEVNVFNGRKAYVKEEDITYILNQIYLNVSDYATPNINYNMKTREGLAKEVSIKLTIDVSNKIAKVKFSSLEDTIDFNYSELNINENDGTLMNIELGNVISSHSEAYSKEAKNKVNTFINDRGIKLNRDFKKAGLTGLEVWNEYKASAERNIRNLVEEGVSCIILPNPSFSTKRDIHASFKKEFKLNRNEEFTPGTTVTSTKNQRGSNIYIMSTQANSMFKNNTTKELTPGSVASIEKLTKLINDNKGNAEEEILKINENKKEN